MAIIHVDSNVGYTRYLSDTFHPIYNYRYLVNTNIAVCPSLGDINEGA